MFVRSFPVPNVQLLWVMFKLREEQINGKDFAKKNQMKKKKNRRGWELKSVDLSYLECIVHFSDYESFLCKFVMITQIYLSINFLLQLCVNVVVYNRDYFKKFLDMYKDLEIATRCYQIHWCFKYEFVWPLSAFLCLSFSFDLVASFSPRNTSDHCHHIWEGVPLANDRFYSSNKYLGSLELTSLVRKTTTLSNMSSWLLARTIVPTGSLLSNALGPNSSLSLSSVVSLVRLIVVVLAVSLVAVKLVSNVVLRGEDRHQQAIT